MVYAYCRVSKPSQRMERQIRNVTEWFTLYSRENPVKQSEIMIYQDRYTGTKMQRPNWKKLCKRLKTGDVIVFDSVSRMSRDAEEGVKAYMNLYDMGVSLFFIKEPMINTNTYRQALDNRIQIQTAGMDNKTSNLIEGIENALNGFMRELAREQIVLAFQQAEKEVKDLQKRTSEGMKQAVEEGRVGVHKGDKIITYKSLTAKLAIIKYSKAFEGILTDKDSIRLIVDERSGRQISRKTYYKYKQELFGLLEENTLEDVKKSLEEKLKVMKARREKNFS